MRLEIKSFTTISPKQFIKQIRSQNQIEKQKKQIFKDIKKKENKADKKRFSRYFDYKPSTLVSNLLNQSKQDLKKNLDEIEQQKIKLNADERNSTNNTVKMTDLI